MTKNQAIAPMPYRGGLSRRQVQGEKRSGKVLRAALPAALLQFAGAFLAMEFVPHYGEAISGLFSQVSQGLSFALDR